MVKAVFFDSLANKQLSKCPIQIRQKILVWVTSVESKGLMEVRKQPSWHDEPLKE
jgi:hypothetical protein